MYNPDDDDVYTIQEAWELDDLLTRTDNYLMTKASEAHTTPAQIIGEMVRERIAASA